MKPNRTDEQLREPLSPHDQNNDQEKGEYEEDKQVLLTKRKYPTRLNKYGYGTHVTCTQKYITCIASKYMLTYEQKIAYEALYDTAVPYDQSNSEHEVKLEQLWKVAFPNAELGLQKTDDRWKAIGFQSNNPRTDFRGGGLLSLKVIIYFMIHFPDENKVLQTSSVYGNLPLAISIINLVFMLMKCVFLKKEDIKSNNTKIATMKEFYIFTHYLKRNPECFEEITSMLILFLMKEWRTTTSKQPLMNFGEFQENSKGLLSYILSDIIVDSPTLKAKTDEYIGRFTV